MIIFNPRLFAAVQLVSEAKRNYKRALTNHNREQTRGATDMSVQQTKRMALAVAALQKAAFKLRDTEQTVERLRKYLELRRAEQPETKPINCKVCGKEVIITYTDKPANWQSYCSYHFNNH